VILFLLGVQIKISEWLAKAIQSANIGMCPNGLKGKKWLSTPLWALAYR
jgi:hypothetical protein